ncbi:MAG: translation initiation factor IF-2 subunit alpha [Candidatus Methanomethylophilaceae archaeon]|jgi:translation initiation factor 2 subunit 1
MSRARGFPEYGELVVCSVQDVKNYGAFVTLDEYDEKVGFIHIRDVATGWVKYIRDYVREGQKVVCKVLGVDSKKGQIDLSLKSVNAHQKREKIQFWKNDKKAEKLMEIIAERMSVPEDATYSMFGNDLVDTYGTLYGAFEGAVADPETFFEEFSGEWTDAFMEVAKENITVSMVQIDGTLMMTSSAPNGVVLIREALEAGLAVGEEFDVGIHCIGCPRYRIVVKAREYKEAEEILKDVSDAAIQYLEDAGGTAALKR